LHKKRLKLEIKNIIVKNSEFDKKLIICYKLDKNVTIAEIKLFLKKEVEKWAILYLMKNLTRLSIR